MARRIGEERETGDPELSLIGLKKARVLGPLDRMDTDKLKKTVVNERFKKMEGSCL